MANNKYAHNHYMQLPAWATAKGRTGFEVREVNIKTAELGELQLFLYVRNVPGIGRFAYGPMWLNVFAEPGVASALHEAASDCFMVRLEPAVPRDELDMQAAKDTGFVYANGRHNQYLSTLVVDLSKPEEDVLMSLHKTARYDIKQAREKFNVTCENLPIDEQTVKLFTDINNDTKQRKQFYTRAEDFLQDYWNEFNYQGQGNLYAAKHEGKTIAMAYVIVNGDKAFYKDAGSLPNNTGAASALQWFIIQDLIKRGVKAYDLCGALASGKESDQDPLWGVYKFKSKFSKNLVTYPGFIDLPIKKAKYALWRKNERLITKVHRKLTGEIFY
ncbi:MAG: methicillin resistance protein [Candidatus Saccharibacteria bacterium]|nr:methicillin resistance protein [Candidatus Saccharibacteria bacterium]